MRVDVEMEGGWLGLWWGLCVMGSGTGLICRVLGIVRFGEVVS